MDKIFLIDSNQITYQNLIDYVNGNSSFNYTDMELYFLNIVKGLVSTKVSNISDLIDNMYTSNKSIQLYTSGTTGAPKEIYQSFKNMVRSIKVSEHRVNDIWGLFYHPTKMAGYQVFFQALLNKNTLVNMFQYDFKDVVNRIQNYSVTHISATPTLYKMIVSNDKIFNSVQQITFGGEGSTEKIQTQIQKYFPNAKMKNIYASTEAGSIFASDDDLFRIPAQFENSIKIENNEIWIHKSIVGESEFIKFNSDWYNSGDLVEFVDEYRFKIIGRSSNVVKIAGYSVNLESVEQKIQKMNFVNMCRVYAEQNSVLGNILVCELIQIGELTVRDIKQLFKENLEKYEIPSKIRFVKSIEINENGKIKR
jgi:acyl-coenzyme A synthetase/AMP-(fatty) acid ligase